MKKIGFIFSWITALIGVITIIMTATFNKVMPIKAYMNFQSSGGGSYLAKWYMADFKLINTIAAVLIVGGVVLAVCFWRSKRGE